MDSRLIIAGFGGQGVMLIGQLLGYTANDSDRKATYYPSYGPEMRGGTANCTVVVSDEEIASPVPNEIDVLIAMNDPSKEKFMPKLKKGGILITNSNHVHSKERRDDIRYIEVPADDIAKSVGNPKASNMVMIGAYLSVANILTIEQFTDTLKVQLAKKAKFFASNKEAILKGAQATKV